MKTELKPNYLTEIEMEIAINQFHNSMKGRYAFTKYIETNEDRIKNARAKFVSIYAEKHNLTQSQAISVLVTHLRFKGIIEHDNLLQSLDPVLFEEYSNLKTQHSPQF